MWNTENETLDLLSTCRQDRQMAKTSTHSKKPTHRQIVGFSLPPETALEVKVEAARRQLSLRKLFEEMWALYKENNKRKGVHAR
jgi:hypothetical protein